ncbi:E2 domain-associated cysteine-rich protein [Mesorhizobium calcicola]|uniref:E2 domain-associated cysteine-rich protein n=1 Tax=Mesorhizobium calcicola TaxID=1300310 RepID=A0ABW4WDS8_9HYPH
MTAMSALALLAETARDNHSDLVSWKDNVAIFAVQPVNASGAPATRFLITVADTGDKIVAKEAKTEHLPSFCPERHINFDGTFCLYWAEAEPLEITDAEAARRWWGKLLIFLLRQRTAAALCSWPGKGEARAHGPEAARYQAAAEASAIRIGGAFEKALKEGRLTTLRRRHGGHDRLRLLLDGRRLLTVDVETGQVMTRRQRCQCDRGSGLPLAACSDHAQMCADLAAALEGWRLAEAKFFDSFKDSSLKCCGTMDECPLRDLVDTELSIAA